MNELGKRVKKRRLVLGLTQIEVATRVGRSHSWLSGLERGLAGDVPSEILTALAVELQEEPDEYLRLAGRAVLRAERVTPVALDPRVVATIDASVSRAFDRLADRLIAFLDERLPPSGAAL